MNRNNPLDLAGLKKIPVIGESQYIPAMQLRSVFCATCKNLIQPDGSNLVLAVNPAALEADAKRLHDSGLEAAKQTCASDSFIIDYGTVLVNKTLAKSILKAV